ncbi:hypothetical protein PSACC_02499 [Paramicrosporidium saccamoebae]|uniref:Uncharacterized protein n=1 Tax=Paramicrosporidium saccamoebae TaxID=1246581 RepID=A0A2H9TIZ5_9FUNG|nr:hypothetical protein PSACC_02499 [Paramicrosporidium saccamoebae]
MNTLGWKATTTSAVALVTCVVHLLGLKLHVHMLGIWVVFAVCAPFLQNDSKMWAAVAALASIVALFVMTRITETHRNHAMVKRVLACSERVSPKLDPTRDFSRHGTAILVICLSYTLIAFVSVIGDPKISGETGWYLVGILFFAIFVHARLKQSPKAVLVFIWFGLGIGCWCGTPWTIPRNDPEMLILVTEAALSHVVTVYKADIGSHPKVH